MLALVAMRIVKPGGRSLGRAVLSDTRMRLEQCGQYARRNLSGVRVTPDCRISRLAFVEPGVIFVDHCRVHPRARVGALTYGTRCVIDNGVVGRLCSLAPGVLIGPNEHPLSEISTHPLAYDGPEFDAALEPAVVGDDVWVGANATILAGARVASGSVVAAGSVVKAKFDHPYAIVGGTPANIIGWRQPRQPTFLAALAAAQPSEVPDVLKRFADSSV